MDPLFIIDGFNVLHAGILTGRERASWWHATTQRRLIARLEQCLYAETALWVVFDRRSERPEEDNVTSEDPRLRIFYAPSADDWIVRQVEEHAHNYTITVVTADRLLRERVRRVGGVLSSPLQFLSACG